jgi:DNA topoisomerase-1
MSNLVIVESPAKCSKIQGFLGLVIASLGHIRHLKEELESVGIEKDFEGSWEMMKEKAKAINQIKDVAKQATTIYLASDDDREGELIAYSVCLLLKLDPATTPRAVFHEITKSAVQAAVDHPRTLDMNKVKAAEARAMLDMMVGFTISPLLWKHVAPGLSAGRCQTPALSLVCDRAEAIESFKPSSSWKVHGEWHTNGSALSWPAALSDELEDEESAEAYLENHHNEPGGTILSADTKPWTESPPLPLITSTLQQQASSLFRMNPKDAMRVAQRLYEAGHITYMRTDKAVLSDEAVQAAHTYIQATYGPSYIGGAAKPKATKKKTKAVAEEGPKAQEAHEAIRPTHMETATLPQTEDWSARDRKLYYLIWLRAMQSTMAHAKGEQRTVVFVADGDDKDDFTWRASWRRTTFDGWRRAATKETTEESSEEEESNEQWSFATSLAPGQRVEWVHLDADPHETKAPPRFTEATLIKQLEEKGIGRPSTFASLISTIVDKAYVEIKSFEAREVSIHTLHVTNHNEWPPTKEEKVVKLGGEKDRLTPTPLGKSVRAFCATNFQDLFNYEFTAHMESRLDAIAEGREVWKQVLRDTWTTYKDRYESLKQVPSSLKESSARRRDFGDNLAAVMTKKGPLLLREDPAGDKDKTTFYGWPTGVDFETLTEEAARKFAETAGAERTGLTMGIHEGHPVIRKSGKFGTYAEWNGKTTSCSAQDSLEAIIQKFQATASNVLRQVGQFEIRSGPYGPYMFKKDITGPKRAFVSVPAHVNIQEVNEAQLIAIFQHELQNKARSGTYGASRGGSNAEGPRGRGGFRGRGRGK